MACYNSDSGTCIEDANCHTHHISLQKRNFVFHILICPGAVIYIKDEGKEKYKIFTPVFMATQFLFYDLVSLG